MNKVGKNTPAYYSEKLNQVVIGQTLNEALGVGAYYNVPGDWERVTKSVKIPTHKRRVIMDGDVMPENKLIVALAGYLHDITGTVSVYAGSRSYGEFEILYSDNSRLILRELPEGFFCERSVEIDLNKFQNKYSSNTRIEELSVGLEKSLNKDSSKIILEYVLPLFDNLKDDSFVALLRKICESKDKESSMETSEFAIKFREEC